RNPAMLAIAMREHRGNGKCRRRVSRRKARACAAEALMTVEKSIGEIAVGRDIRRTQPPRRHLHQHVDDEDDDAAAASSSSSTRRRWRCRRTLLPQAARSFPCKNRAESIPRPEKPKEHPPLLLTCCARKKLC